MSESHKRFRCKMVKVFDNYYFDEFKGDELKDHIDRAVEVVDDLKSMDQVEDFMSQRQNISFPEDQLQWHLWLVPNFKDNESLVICKSHHVLADGLGWLLMLGGLQDTYNPNQYIQTTKVLSKCKKFLLTLAKPFTMTFSFLGFLFWSTDKNVIKKSTVLKSSKKNAISKPFDVPTLKEISKQHHGTVNDIVLSILSVSLH